MVSVGRHENITLLSYSEVEAVSGFVGSFQVRVRRKARHVKEDLCTGCGTCVQKCPWRKIPSEFDLGLGTRPAIYFPFGQAVPRVPVIDTEHCAYFAKGTCRACAKFCPREAIDFEQTDQQLELEVGTIILATGFQNYDPRRDSRFGYGELPDVVTGPEFERLVNSGGPTLGQVLRADGTPPKKVALIHCVGSRGEAHEYCSRVCCMYSLKLAHLVHDATGAEVTEFYRDMRTFGKDYESFYRRVVAEGIHTFRYEGDVQVTQADGHLRVTATDVFTGKSAEIESDMVILATGLEPQADQRQVARRFGVSLSPDGFFLERHPKLAPVETASDGIFLAGTCQGPKDIPDSVAQGGAAAAAALSLMDAGYVYLEPFTVHVLSERCSGCRTCQNLCPFGAIQMAEHDGRTVSTINEVLCKGCGTCAAACPAGAIYQNNFSNDQVIAEILGALSIDRAVPQEAFP